MQEVKWLCIFFWNISHVEKPLIWDFNSKKHMKRNNSKNVRPINLSSKWILQDSLSSKKITKFQLDELPHEIMHRLKLIEKAFR